MLKISLTDLSFNASVRNHDWAAKVCLNGHDAQILSKDRTEATFDISKLRTQPILCMIAMGPSRHSSCDVYGGAGGGSTAWRIEGFRDLALTGNGAQTIAMHDPCTDGDASVATVTAQMHVSGLPKGLKGARIPKQSYYSEQSYNSANASYIQHWSDNTPIGETAAEKQRVARIHSPYFNVDGVVLPITYYIRRMASVRDVVGTQNYYQNALLRCLETSKFTLATFGAAAKNPENKDVLRVCSDLVLFQSRFTDYLEDKTVLSGAGSELYADSTMALGHDSADCEDFAKLCQTSFYTLKDSFKGSKMSAEMAAAQSVLAHYACAIVQGAVHYHGGLTNHVWATLVPKKQLEQMSGVSKEGSSLPLLLLEGTSESQQRSHEDPLVFHGVKSGYSRFYKYVLDLHLPPSEAAHFPVINGTCTDYIVVDKNKKEYGVEVHDFFNGFGTHSLAAALVTTKKQDKDALKDYSFLPDIEAPTLDSVTNFRGNRPHWQRVYLAGKDVAGAARVDDWWGLK